MNSCSSIYKNPVEISEILNECLQNPEMIIYFNFYENSGKFFFSILEIQDIYFRKPLSLRNYYMNTTESYKGYFCGAHASKIISDFSNEICKFENFKRHFTSREYYFIDWSLVAKLFDEKSRINISQYGNDYVFEISHSIIENKSTHYENGIYKTLYFPIPDVNSNLPENFIEKYYEIISDYKDEIRKLTDRVKYLDSKIDEDIKLISEIN